ncbi:unnamed protein product, partial [Iphiclides podalirius]
MRWFDGQGRGRAILPRAAASAGLSCAPSFWKQLPQGINAQFGSRVTTILKARCNKQLSMSSLDVRISIAARTRAPTPRATHPHPPATARWMG